jgi:putative ABC transport system permease protein
MVMVIDRKIKRTMLKNKSKYIGMFFLIVISCLLYISLTLSALSIKEGISSFFKSNAVEDANFMVQNPLDKTTISNYESKFHIVLEEQKMTDYQLDSDTVLRILKKSKKLNLYSITDGKQLSGENEILLIPSFAKAHSLKVGDSIKIQGNNFKVVGFFTKPDYLYPLKSENDVILNTDTFGLAILGDKDFGKLENQTIFYSVKGEKLELSKLKDDISKDNMIIRWIDKNDNQRISNINGVIDTFSIVANTVPIAILIVICMLTAIILNRLLKEEYVQIGMLSALGYRKSEIMKHYLRYPLILAVFGSLCAILPGIFFAKPVAMLLDIKYNMPTILIDIKPMIIVISVILPFLFLIPSTLIVVARALRITPLELIRGGKNKIKIGFLERIIHLDHFSFKRKFQLRELLRNISRDFITILGVVLATVLLLFGFVLNDSLNYLVHDSINETYLYEHEYMFKTLQNKSYENAEKVSIDNCNTVYNNKTYSFSIYGLDSATKLIVLKDSRGNKIDYNKNIITKPLAEKLNVSIGDIIKVVDKQSGKSFDIKIDAIANTYVGEFIFMPIYNLNQLLKYPEGSYIELLSKTKISVDESQLLSNLTKSSILEGYESMMMPIKAFVGVMAVMAFVIGLIIIYILTVMLIEENSNNISLLKVLGYSNKKISSLVIDSTILLVFIGFFVGLGCSLMLMNKLFQIMAAGMSISIPVKLDLLSLVVAFIIIFVTYFAAKYKTQKKVIQISMVDSLKNRGE